MSTPHLLAAVYELGVGRTVPTIAALAGLASVLGAGLALRRLGAAHGRLMAGTATAVGLVSAIVGAVHGANAAGGLGTGNGLAGAIVAVALGLGGAVLGGLAVARSRRTGRSAGSTPRR